MSVGLSDSRRGDRQLPDRGAVSSQNFETDSGSRHFVKRRRASEVKLTITVFCCKYLKNQENQEKVDSRNGTKHL